MEKDIAEIFRALGNPGRIQIIEILSRNPCTYAELRIQTGLLKSYLTQQLFRLSKLGLIGRSEEEIPVYRLCNPALGKIVITAMEIIEKREKDRVEKEDAQKL